MQCIKAILHILSPKVKHFIHRHFLSDQMIREADHSATISLSSIALLQERFRQLERMKEMRLEKELLRMLSESEKYNNPPATMQYEPISVRVFGSKLMYSAKPHCQLSLSLWPDSQITHSSFRLAEKPSATVSWLTGKPFVSPLPIKIDDSDSDVSVDTSLHL